ncbi:MAG TPA: zf-HC2 domain-containing protein [Candidatus Desulfaltia sp.]|nr:zf-HC2 domain-containing protein [Candidatus Desulfaltia sp.]
MKCALAQEWISESLDGELGAKREAELKAHLEGCPDCRALARDFAAIVRQAKNLSSAEPSPAVWPRVATAVRESLKEAPAAVPEKRDWLGAFWNRAAWRYAAAAALALVIVGAVVIRQKPWRATDSAREGSVEYALAKLQEAQGYYEKAIQSLNEAVQSQDGSLAPQLAEIFKRNLAAMDETILACRRIVERDPGNLTARAYLLTAYREKVDTLEEMMGLERSSAREKAETVL